MPEAEDVLEAIDVSAKIVNARKIEDVVELSNGVKLRCKAVPVLTLRYAMASIPKPNPPEVEIPEKGRVEAWEGSPLYQEQLERWSFKVEETTFNVMFTLGTSLEYVPDGIFKPEDDGWVEIMEAAGIPVNLKSVPARYVSWLRFYALSEPEDVTLISQVVAKKSGLLEKDVGDAIQSFRGGENGAADMGGDSEKHSEDGNIVSLPDNRNGSGSGGAR